MVVTIISGTLGEEKVPIAEEVSKKLDIPYYEADDMIREYAAKTNKTYHDIFKLSDKQLSKIIKDGFRDKSDQNAIFIGRFANIACYDLADVKIYLIMPSKESKRSFAAKLALKEKNVKKVGKKIKIDGVKISDPSRYDVVINMDQLDKKTIVNVISETIKSKSK